MHDARHSPRITDTRDLQVRLRPAGRPAAVAGVLNLSNGGALITAGGLTSGEITPVELVGPDFRCAGVAQVAHHDVGRTGVRFLSWQGHGHRPLRALVEQRSRRGQEGLPRQREERVIRRVAVIVGARSPARSPARSGARRPAGRRVGTG